MATLSFTFNTGTITLAEILDAFATAYNYSATIPNPAIPGTTLPNPETKAVFARRKVREYVLDIVRAERLKTARATAETGVAVPVFTD